MSKRFFDYVGGDFAMSIYDNMAMYMERWNWFYWKNEEGESILYTLADIKVRSDVSFAKDYMTGK